ncbi:hypothetical protein E9531_03685 [Lampropedia puyangensis]|uniref:Roadblock/LC7 domain-containing protein n=1 Tax=Lampropedia puyangensis TaxID=1330072 RepID=A0A4S8FBW4_9BURK|nr:hypothetical protein [Lampropedia puyangensis]THU04501.1 hypothetical protein E9531_03685 [Lampropedia puyangensis]
MSAAYLLRQALDQLAQDFPDLKGCVLVEISTGMVWHAAGGNENIAVLSEAASDYWRLCGRLELPFAELGELQACVFLHKNGRITMMQCGQDMFLLTLSIHHAPVDWAAWQKRTHAIAKMVNEL